MIPICSRKQNYKSLDWLHTTTEKEKYRYKIFLGVDDDESSLFLSSKRNFN